MNTAYISTAYLGPIQLYTKLLAYDQICLETQENYLKQTYRNRCIIAAANGPQALTVTGVIYIGMPWSQPIG